MAPAFDLPVRMKPCSESTRQHGRITKATKRGKSTMKRRTNVEGQTKDDLAAITLQVAHTQLSRNQTALANNEISLFASILAGTVRKAVRTSKLTPSTGRRRKQCRTTDRPSLILADAAEDVLASLEGLSLEHSPTGIPISVSFYSLDTLDELTQGIVVMSNEAEDLIELTTIMLRRRRAFFRESDLTKSPPMMWRFTVHHRHVEDAFYNNNPDEGQLVVRNTYSETCIAHDVQTEHDASRTARPDEAYLRFLGACNDHDILKMLVDDHESQDSELTYGRRRNEPLDTKLFSDTDEVLGSVDVWFR